MENNNQPGKSTARQFKEFLLEVTRIVLISVAIIVPIRYYLVQPFYVKGASMEPSFYDHEYLLIDELSYRLREPERGEIVVFHFPLNQREYFIKRIIGLPGETVAFRDGSVYIYNESNPDGFKLDESGYLDEGVKTLPPGENTVSLKADEYFVMGDNRTRSLDSRDFGPVKSDLLVGRAVFRGYPFNRVDNFFHAPQY